MLRVRDLGRLDTWMRRAYQVFAPVHDPIVAAALPLLQGLRETEQVARAVMVDRLDVAGLTPHPDRPRRILDVGVGTGRLLPYLERATPRGTPLELWGVDISPGMMGRARRIRTRTAPKLLLADVHRLPFSDATFDRVVQIGGVGGFSDPTRAVQEMIRVTTPGGRLLLVDEQLDPNRRHSLAHRAAFRLLTAYQPEATAPTPLLGDQVTDVRDEQLSRFFYCLSFRRRP